MEAVRKRVLKEFSQNGQVCHLQVDVIIEDGVIFLEGDVTSYYQKQLAQEAVRRVIDGRSKNGNGCPYLALSIKNNLRVP